MTLIAHDIEGLLALKSRMEDRLATIDGICAESAKMWRSLGSGVDLYPMVEGASLLRHRQINLRKLAGEVMSLCAWLEALERNGAFSVGLPPLVGMGISTVPTHPGLDGANSIVQTALGKSPFAAPGGRDGALLASSDSRGSAVQYKSDPYWQKGGRGAYYGPQGDSRYQCTAWANFRWRELGYSGAPIGGHGGAMAGVVGGVSADPTLGALASYRDGDFGHVMVVEEIERDQAGHVLRIRMSEGNVGDDQLVGHESEWGGSRWWTPKNGGWSTTDPPPGRFAIAFAAFRGK